AWIGASPPWGQAPPPGVRPRLAAPDPVRSQTPFVPKSAEDGDREARRDGRAVRAIRLYADGGLARIAGGEVDSRVALGDECGPLDAGRGEAGSGEVGDRGLRGHRLALVDVRPEFDEVDARATAARGDARARRIDRAVGLDLREQARRVGTVVAVGAVLTVLTVGAILARLALRAT